MKKLILFLFIIISLSIADIVSIGGAYYGYIYFYNIGTNQVEVATVKSINKCLKEHVNARCYCPASPYVKYLKSKASNK